MAETKLNQELIEQLQKCKTKEEVAKFAKENQLTDEELEKVTGGWRTLAVQGWLAGANGEQERNLATIKPSNS